jgi:hypothetical protein
MASSTASDNPDDIHPSDCSWASSSTSSSCRSLDEAEIEANSSDSDSATIRRPAESFSDDKRQK